MEKPRRSFLLDMKAFRERQTSGSAGFSLWVYYPPNARIAAQSIIETLEHTEGHWEGDGCCTDGMADISWHYHTYAAIKRAFSNITRVPGVMFAKVVDTATGADLHVWKNTRASHV